METIIETNWHITDGIDDEAVLDTLVKLLFGEMPVPMQEPTRLCKDIADD